MMVDSLLGPDVRLPRLIMPGAGMDGASIYEILTQEKVTITAAVRRSG